MITLKELPVEAICAVYACLTLGRFIVLEQHVFNHTDNLVRCTAAPPTEVFHSVVATYQTSMADGLHSVPANGAGGCEGVACAHEDGVGGVAEVVTTCANLHALVAEADLVAWWSGEAEADSWQGFAGSFEGDDWDAVGQADQTRC